VIHEQAERAAKIVRDLLAFARKGPSDEGDVDINDVTRRALSLIGYELRLRAVELKTDFAPELGPVRGDRHQIQQVVVNLITNAAQAMSEQDPDLPRELHVSTTLERKQAVLRVADSGPGIPEEMLPRIFDPFVTSKASGKGTGLGLSITYRIVEDHGGRLTAENRPEGGALFTVALPAGRPTPAPSEAPAEGGEAGAPSAGGGHRILLVDDDPAVRRMIGVLFAQDGQDVEAATDTRHALDLLERNRYDLVIADARAAVSAGEGFAEVVTARFPEIAGRTILLTADVRPETEEWLRALGCRYFRKPFNVRELRAAAAEILS